MKKYGLYAAIILWVVIAGIYLAASKQASAVSLAKAFESSMSQWEWQELNTYIEGYGEFGVCYLTEQEKEELVWNIAGAIGIKSPCHLSSERMDDGLVTVLTKDSLNGAVIIKSITKEKRQEDGSLIATQYVYVKITAYNNVDCATDYRELVEGVFEAMGIEGNVNINLVGSIAGMLNLEQKNALADELLENLDAKVIAENRTSDIFTIYAYSEGIKPTISIGGSSINVNIAMGYDEMADCTEVYLASPISSLDY